MNHQHGPGLLLTIPAEHVGTMLSEVNRGVGGQGFACISYYFYKFCCLAEKETQKGDLAVINMQKCNCQAVKAISEEEIISA